MDTFRNYVTLLDNHCFWYYMLKHIFWPKFAKIMLFLPPYIQTSCHSWIIQPYTLHTASTRGGNLRDLVFVTNPTLVKFSNNVPGISGHDIIITDQESSRKCYIYKEAKWDQINIDIKHTLVEVMEKHQQGAKVHQLLDTFKSQLLNTMNTNIPNKEKRSRN